MSPMALSDATTRLALSGTKVWVCEIFEGGERVSPVRVFSDEGKLAAFVHSQSRDITTVSYEQIVDEPEAFDGRHRH